ncbi:hypothetical protein AIT97_002882 [Salmonella enterica subsp. indica]
MQFMLSPWGTDETKQWWFNITGSGWLPEKDLAEAGQYDFLKLGFQPLEERSSGDMTKSPYEGWVPEAFDSVSRAAEQGDESGQDHVKYVFCTEKAHLLLKKQAIK